MRKYLINQLTELTESFKEEYISQCKVYANIQFERAEQINSWMGKDWCLFFGLEPRKETDRSGGEYLTLPKGFYNTSNARIKERKANEAYRICQMGLEEFKANEIKNAEAHFKSSIEKLVDRILKKGLLINENLTVNVHHLKINLDVRVTDENKKSVHAYTIIASGEVQRPHYRYIIK